MSGEPLAGLCANTHGLFSTCIIKTTTMSSSSVMSSSSFDEESTYGKDEPTNENINNTKISITTYLGENENRKAISKFFLHLTGNCSNTSNAGGTKKADARGGPPRAITGGIGPPTN
mgnify:CR=1 FL=1